MWPFRPKPPVVIPGVSPEFLVLSRRAAEEYRPGEEEACISIIDPGQSEANLGEGFREVLRLEFDDVRPGGVMGAELPFTPEAARAVVDFALRQRHLDRFIIHCTAGASRSPAVAVALAEGLGGRATELAEMYPALNPFVRAVIRAEFRLRAR